jgi:hypothetical protein
MRVEHGPRAFSRSFIDLQNSTEILSALSLCSRRRLIGRGLSSAMTPIDP